MIFLVDQFGDALDEDGAVHVVGDFGDDDLLAPALELFEADFAAHFDAASAGLEIVLDRRPGRRPCSRSGNPAL